MVVVWFDTLAGNIFIYAIKYIRHMAYIFYGVDIFYVTRVSFHF